MARVHEFKEVLDFVEYDAFFVPRGVSFGEEMQRRDPRVIRFFVDVQNKTRLDTNLQAAGVLPSLNTFETRAMRVIVSPPQAELDCDKVATAGEGYCKGRDKNRDEARKQLCAEMQAEFNRASAAVGSSLFLAGLIYNSVTSLIVGEKTMVEAPTFWFPGGAGVLPANGTASNHGEPDPTATFRFAEPVTIEPQQNFRVEMLFPAGIPPEVNDAGGPLRIWVALHGYLKRDVQ
jgi:hypothetical protein